MPDLGPPWELEKLLAAVVEATHDAVFVKDLEGRYLMMNAAGAAMVRKSLPEVLGLDDRALFDAASAARIMARDQDILRGGEPITYEHAAHLGREPRLFQTTKAPLRDLTGRVRGLVGISRDVTDDRRGEAEKLALIEQLRSSNLELQQTQAQLLRQERLAAVGELAAMVAHEVRNPLGAIFNAVSALRQESPAPVSAALIGIIAEESERLNRMVADLLDLARPLSLQLQPEPVSALFAQALGTVLPEPALHAIRVDHSGDQDARAHVDAHHFRQALENLIRNAVDAMPKGGTLSLGVSTAEEEVRVFVRDTGAGIDETTRRNIFNPFFTTKAQGTGLGLTIVKRIVEAHGGRVEVRSAPGKGSEFQIRLPAEAGH